MEGAVTDVRWKGPADRAHLTPGDKIIGINGQMLTNEVALEAVRASKTESGPLHLIVQSGFLLRQVDIDYHDGERYPTLERVEGAPDYLDDITKPLTTPDPASLLSTKDRTDQ